MTKPVSPEYLETVRKQTQKAIWGYLNLLIPDSLGDSDIDQATEKFFEAGLTSVNVWLMTKLSTQSIEEFERLAKGNKTS